MEFQNIDIYIFYIDISIAAHFYRYINIADISDSSTTLSNNFFSEAVRLILSILHILHLQMGGTNSYVEQKARRLVYAGIHFQTTSSLMLYGRLFPYYTYSIYRWGEQIVMFFVPIG